MALYIGTQGMRYVSRNTALAILFLQSPLTTDAAACFGLGGAGVAAKAAMAAKDGNGLESPNLLSVFVSLRTVLLHCSPFAFPVASSSAR